METTVKDWNISNEQIKMVLRFLSVEQCNRLFALRMDTFKSPVPANLETVMEDYPNVFIKPGDNVLLTVDGLDFYGTVSGHELIYDRKHYIEKRIAGHIFETWDYHAWVTVFWNNTPNMKHGMPYCWQPLCKLKKV